MKTCAMSQIVNNNSLFAGTLDEHKPSHVSAEMNIEYYISLLMNSIHVNLLLNLKKDTRPRKEQRHSASRVQVDSSLFFWCSYYININFVSQFE